MPWDISISPDGWGEIYMQLQKKSGKWLAHAVAADEAQHAYDADEDMTEAQQESFEAKRLAEYLTLPQDMLVEMAFACIEKNNTCDVGGYAYWIDKEGGYKIVLK